MQVFAVECHVFQGSRKVVQRVQADLEELRVTVRGNDPNWVRARCSVPLKAL